MRAQHAGALRDPVAQFCVGEFLLLPGDRGIVDQRQLIAAAVGDVIIDRQVAGIQFAVGEPVVNAVLVGAENAARGLVPVERTGLVGPEAFGIVDRRLVFFFI